MRFVEVEISSHKVVGEFTGPVASRRDAQDGTEWVENYQAEMGIHRLDITQTPHVLSDEPDSTPQKRFKQQFADGFDLRDLERINRRIDQIDTLAGMRAALKKIVLLIYEVKQ